MPIYSPIQIIPPSHVSDSFFSVISTGRLDIFKIKYAGEKTQKTVIVSHEAVKSLDQQGIKS